MKGFAEAHRHKHGFKGFVYDTLKEQDETIKEQDERIKALEEASNSSDTPAEETPSDNNTDTPADDTQSEP